MVQLLQQQQMHDPGAHVALITDELPNTVDIIYFQSSIFIIRFLLVDTLLHPHKLLTIFDLSLISDRWKLKWIKIAKMIDCTLCKEWYHTECVSIPTSANAWNDSACNWYCNNCSNEGADDFEKINNKKINKVNKNITSDIKLFRLGDTVSVVSVSGKRIILHNICTIDSCYSLPWRIFCSTICPFVKVCVVSYCILQ